MDKSKVNNSIQCTVDQCKYHCGDKEYCSLDQIMVGTHEQNPTQTQCTDCNSFQVKG